MSRRLILVLLVVLIIGVVGGTAYFVVNRLRSGQATQETPGGSSSLTQAPTGGQNVVNPTGDDDADGLTNSDEVLWGTDPKNPDTDGDNYFDGEEVKAGYNPTIPSPNDKLPEGFVPGKDLAPLPPAASEPIAVDQFFQDNLDLTLGTKNYTEDYKKQVPEAQRTSDTLDSYVHSQAIITQLPAPEAKATLLQKEDTPNVFSEYLETTDSVIGSFSDRSIFAKAINDVFSTGDTGSISSLATTARLQQERLVLQAVPPSAANLHKLLLGYNALLAATFDQIAKYNDDEVRAVVAMRQWEEIDKKYVPLIEREQDRLAALSSTHH